MGTLLRDHEIKDFQLSTNQVYIDAVNRVGHRIANAITERPDLADDWEFTVIDSPIVNDFATGGGKVVVFEGFLDKISKDNGGKPDEDIFGLRPWPRDDTQRPAPCSFGPEYHGLDGMDHRASGYPGEGFVK